MTKRKTRTKKKNNNAKNSIKSYYKYLIIGAGPAGLQLGYYFNKTNDDYIILERNGNSGSFFEKYPIHRKLISVNKRNIESDPGTDLNEFAYRHDWNSLICDNKQLRVKNYSNNFFPDADDLVKYLNDFSKYYKLNIGYNCLVTKIKKIDNTFEIIIKNNNVDKIINCKYLFICTGVSQEYIPPIKGIEYTIPYKNLSNDSKEFENKNVAIIGRGNSGLEVADSIINNAKYICLVGRNPPKFAWETHYVGDTRAINNNFYDTYQLKTLSMSYDVPNLEIKKTDSNKYELYGVGTEYDFDKVIRCTGFQFDFSIFDNTMQQKVFRNRFPEITNEFESTSTENLFFCGTISQSLDFKVSTLAFIHGFRYTGKFIHDIVKERELSKQFDFIRIDKDIQKLTVFIAKEITENSCIWQLFRYWCVLVVVEEDHFKIFRNLPVDYVKQNKKFNDHDIIIITLDYGFEDDDSVFERFPSYQEFHGYLSKFIHPVLRYYPQNDNTNSRFNAIHLVQCVCGEWEEIPFMKKYTLCKKCINRGYCTICQHMDDLEFLYQHGQCNNCLNKKEMVKFEKYPTGLNILNVTKSTENSLDKSYCYELQIMEDFLGRYYMKEVSANQIVNNNVTQVKKLSYKEAYLSVTRYLDYVFNQQKINVTDYEYSKRVSKLPPLNYIVLFTYFLYNTTYLINRKEKRIEINLAEYELSVLRENKKVNMKFANIVNHLKKKLNIKEHVFI